MKARLAAVPWGHIVVESALIFGSVYLAIVLESRSQDARDVREARAALVQLLDEIRRDEVDLAEVHAAQDSLALRYADIDRWLDDPATVPGDSMTAALRYLSLNNRTMFPRHAAWTMMVAAGQLPDLDDPALVARLGDLYENVVPRIEYNGHYYDESVDRAFDPGVANSWDSSGRRFAPGGEEVAIRLRESLQRLSYAWNRYYLDLLDDYGERLGQTADAVDAHLRRHGTTPGG